MAIGKFRANVCIQVVNDGVLNKKVAIRLIVGHIIQQIHIEMAYVINCGLSLGLITVNASFLANLPTIKNSSTKAIGTMIGNSLNAAKKVKPAIVFVFRTTL